MHKERDDSLLFEKEIPSLLNLSLLTWTHVLLGEW